MDDADRAHRAALAEHHRRSLRIGATGSAATWSLVVFRRGRDAWARRDHLTLVGIGLAIGSAALTQSVNYRRVERRVDEDLDRNRRSIELAQKNGQESTRTGQGVAAAPLASLIPVDRSAAGCLTQLGLLLAGYATASWDYRHRPDRGRRRVGRRWQFRPGPAWWTAWSWQQLPVNAASTAPRAQQIAYERRQIVTLQVTGTVAETINTWETQLRPALTAREWARLAAGLLKITAKVVNGVADYRRVPDEVDARRARRRRHDTAVAALEAAHASGRPGPANPWRVEMAVIAAGTAAVVASFTASMVHARHRPKPPPTDPPRPPVRKRPPQAA